jgi:hypothetical protein
MVGVSAQYVAVSGVTLGKVDEGIGARGARRGHRMVFACERGRLWLQPVDRVQPL